MTVSEPYEKPDPIFSIIEARDNAEVIEKIATHPANLGYLDKSWLTLDATYGEGRFWTRWKPRRFVGCDIELSKSPIGRSVDFRPGLHGFAPKTFQVVFIDPPYKLCLDAETTMLTRRGWLRWDEVEVGDEAYSRDPDTGVGCWRPVSAVNVYPESPTDVMVCTGKNLNFVATPDHRWPVLDHRDHLVWRTTATLRAHDRVVSAAPWDDTPTVPKYEDAFVELVAWFWTEGDIDHSSTYGKITQSHAVNPAHCARIAAAFTLLYGPPVDSFERVGRYAPAVAWRIKNEGRNRRFIFSAPIGRQLLDAAPGKVPSRSFIEALTVSQRELFISTSTDADGQSATRLSQADPCRSEAFAYACILSGRAVSIHDDPNGRTITMKQPVAKPSRPGVALERRDTLVWCPTVDGTATWLARRRGTIYFTGNSGTSTGEGPSASDESYGVGEYASRADRVGLQFDMLSAAAEVIQPARRQVPGTRRTEMVGGYVFVKGQPQVNGGKVQWTTRHLANHGEALGLRLVDEIHLPSYREQPPRCLCTHTRKAHIEHSEPGCPNCDCTEFRLDRSQQHTRRNFSTFLVFRDESLWVPDSAQQRVLV